MRSSLVLVVRSRRRAAAVPHFCSGGTAGSDLASTPGRHVLAFRAEQVRSAQQDDACGAWKGRLDPGGLPGPGRREGGAPRRSLSQLATLSKQPR